MLLVDRMAVPDISTWNALVVAHSLSDSPRQVPRLLVFACQSRPDNSTLTVALKACAGLLDLRTGREIYSMVHASDLGFFHDVFDYSSLLNL